MLCEAYDMVVQVSAVLRRAHELLPLIIAHPRSAVLYFACDFLKSIDRRRHQYALWVQEFFINTQSITTLIALLALACLNVLKSGWALQEERGVPQPPAVGLR